MIYIPNTMYWTVVSPEPLVELALTEPQNDDPSYVVEPIQKTVWTQIISTRPDYAPVQVKQVMCLVRGEFTLAQFAALSSVGGCHFLSESDYLSWLDDGQAYSHVDLSLAIAEYDLSPLVTPQGGVTRRLHLVEVLFEASAKVIRLGLVLTYSDQRQSRSFQLRAGRNLVPTPMGEIPEYDWFMYLLNTNAAPVMQIVEQGVRQYDQPPYNRYD